MTRSLVLMAVLATGAGQALADSAELARCRAMADSGARLACYDAIPLSPPGAAATQPPSAAPGAPAGAAAPTAAAVTGSTAQAQAAPTPSATPAEFGLENRRRAAAVDAIESVIPGDFTGWEPGQRWRLANGQLWQVADRSRASYALRDPKVKVRRGVVGNFVMEIEGVAQLVRVRRVE